MATGWFGPCPHCNIPLSYLEGITGSKMNPQCPRCKEIIKVSVATFLMVDNTRPSAPRKSAP